MQILLLAIDTVNCFPLNDKHHVIHFQENVCQVPKSKFFCQSFFQVKMFHEKRG